MKSFIKNTASSCLGSLLAFLILAIIIGIVVSTYTAKNKPNQRGILHIPLQGNIQDFSTANFNIKRLDFSTAALSMWDLATKIKYAIDDPEINGIYLEVKSVQITQQTATELARLLKQFKASGKMIYAYSYYYEQNAYLLSSIADSIYLNPNGGVDLKGYALYGPLFKTLLDTLDIDVNIYSAGRYKSGIEPFKFDSFSAENKFQYRTYFDQLRAILVQNVSENRLLSQQEVDTVIKAENSYDVDFMLKNKIVDRLLYDDEFDALLKRDFNNSDLVPISTYEIKGPTSKNANTAIVFAEGEIMWGPERFGTITYESISKSFKAIAKDEKIKNVILRINSPGGNGYTSDLIHREIQVLKNKGKKVYASLGPYATSGGYYIAAACDSIFAEENTLTGSIGVYIILPNISRFLTNKVNVTVDSIATDKTAIPYTPFLSISEEQGQQFMKNTEKLYDQFLDRVSKGREMSKDSVHEIAQGRVWSGKDAIQIGLVDDNIGLWKLIQITAGEEGSVQVFPKDNSSLIEQFFAEGLSKVKFAKSKTLFDLSSKIIDLQDIMKNPAPEMKIPVDFFVIKL